MFTSFPGELLYLHSPAACGLHPKHRPSASGKLQSWEKELIIRSCNDLIVQNMLNFFDSLLDHLQTNEQSLFRMLAEF